MIFFLLALSYVIFQSSDRATLCTIAVGMGLIAGLTSLPIWWGPYSKSWPYLTEELPGVCKDFVAAAARKRNLTNATPVDNIELA